MSLAFHSNKESLYLQVYDHYKNLIMKTVFRPEAVCLLSANVLLN